MLDVSWCLSMRCYIRIHKMCWWYVCCFVYICISLFQKTSWSVLESTHFPGFVLEPACLDYETAPGWNEKTTKPKVLGRLPWLRWIMFIFEGAGLQWGGGGLLGSMEIYRKQLVIIDCVIMCKLFFVLGSKFLLFSYGSLWSSTW